MVLKVLLKFPPTLALVHGWLFPETAGNNFDSNGIMNATLSFEVGGFRAFMGKP